MRRYRWKKYKQNYNKFIDRNWKIPRVGKLFFKSLWSHTLYVKLSRIWTRVGKIKNTEMKRYIGNYMHKYYAFLYKKRKKKKKKNNYFFKNIFNFFFFLKKKKRINLWNENVVGGFLGIVL